MTNCTKNTTAVLGCLQLAAGGSQSVIIHTTYAYREDGAPFVVSVHYTEANSDNVITLQTGDVVTVGQCPEEREKELILETGNFTANETIAAGFVSATIQVGTGELLVNGATVTPCSPYVLENMSFGDQKCTYPQVTVTTNEPGTEYTMIVQRCP